MPAARMPDKLVEVPLGTQGQDEWILSIVRTAGTFYIQDLDQVEH